MWPSLSQSLWLEECNMLISLSPGLIFHLGLIGESHEKHMFQKKVALPDKKVIKIMGNIF